MVRHRHDRRTDRHWPHGRAARRHPLRGDGPRRRTPRRFAYRADATNAPGLRALLEEWALSPTAVGGTRVRWTFAADGPPALRTFLLMSRPGLGLSFRSAVRSLDRRLAS